MTEPEKPYVCLQCGTRFEYKAAPNMIPSLQKHWAATGHGPKRMQDVAVERAKENLIEFPKR